MPTRDDHPWLDCVAMESSRCPTPCRPSSTSRTPTIKIRFSTIAPFAIMLRPDSSCRGDLPIGIALDPHVRSISRFVSARQLDLVYDRDSLQRRQTGGMKELAQPSLQSCSTPARKPRTECCCHLVAVMIAAIVAPAGARSDFKVTVATLRSNP